tara:strand:+ start:44 stop:802 length:759 start_codon:yes stop_codon:yes gene_type:complete
MNDPLFTRLHIATLTTALCTTVIFTMWPGLDIMASAAFTDGQGNFIATRMSFPSALNAGLRKVTEIAALLTILYTAWLWLARRADRNWLRCWSFLTASFLLGPGLIVNFLLKEQVGRARPANVTLFGGEQQFTAAFQITDQCTTNCSFTSGEAALSAAWVFGLVALLWGGLSARGRAWALLGGGSLVLINPGLRVILGRHFLSDVLVSVLIAALTTLAMYRLLNIGEARAAFAPAQLRARMRSFAGLLRWRR